MIRFPRFSWLLILSLSLASLPAASGAEKELLLPPDIWKIPKNNNFKDDNSPFSFQRSVQSKNFAVFWAKEYGPDPEHDVDPARRIPITEFLKEGERFYEAYVNDLKFVRQGQSVSDKYKVLVFVVGGRDGTANGGGIDDKVGALWTPRSRIDRGPYGALAHELGHSFQYFVHADGAWGFTSTPPGSRGQPIFEMTSQFMLWQVYPDWMTFEKYHLDAFMKQTHLAFLHEDNQYHSPYVLEYWAGKHGADFVGKLWREARPNEDPVMTYKRLNALSQEQFNDEIFDAARRFITWDLPRVEKVAAKYANQHTTKLEPLPDDWYRITESRCPQNYGYNGIRLTVPTPGTIVRLEFKGLAGTEGYRAIETAKAGWRYGFVAVKRDGTRVYGPILRNSQGTGQFMVPIDTKFLWLVVSGAPQEHWIHLVDGNKDNDEQWPYEFRLVNAAPDASVLN